MGPLKGFRTAGFVFTALAVLTAPASAVLTSKSNDSTQSSSKLVSSNDTAPAPVAAAPSNRGQMKIKLRLQPKAPPATAAPPVPVDSATNPETSPETEENDPYALGVSKTVSGAAGDADGTSPVKQVVSGPANPIYSRPAKVRPTGPSTVGIRMTSRSDEA